MGCLNSKPVDPDDKEASQQNAKIEKVIRNDKKTLDRTIKILLLGAGESGKSTIIKQMRIIHSGGFPADERRQNRAVIYSNLIVAFKVLLEIMQAEGIAFTTDEVKVWGSPPNDLETVGANDSFSKEFAALIDKTDPDVSSEEAFSDRKVKDAMEGMWADAGVQKAVARGHEFALHDNLHYFYNSLDRIFEPNWLPDNQDMLHSRLRTTGITETLFELGQMNFRMMDVGGQRSERKKWIHCFDGVQCLLFMVALSGYDQCLVEDQSANQMHEAMMLFESLVNGEWFKRKPIILFLNKIDLFKSKLDLSPVSKHFPDYNGSDTDFDAAAKYFADRFRGINRMPEREIYVHYTNATDTTLLRATMDSVQDMIIQKNLHTLIL
ncbi:guanine nucleotide-binding protein subunit alpha [Paecilomyces variotii No. 5]|uniref:Guanine nucleotide-binding protein subunit alpha n=1 Tax=Byssochlamys spectabilis (strain No. 5 / NBRC 109023) TaxID=1356009 RepID=V5FY72_BYSSN|nr:guanine nucleotide-binding protein subunit alpha [Paecilomyces variotii No. 5]